jgi:hypothetical protein
MPNPRLDGRNGEVWEHYAVKRWTQERIAEKFEITPQRVSQIIALVRDSINVADKGAYIKESVELYRSTIAKLHELAEMDGAPVTAGKDGDLVLDPATGEHVRDYALRLSALKLANDTDAQLRKLLGLDAASKVESTATVRHEIVGVDPDGDLI